jgi:hypothetical protein
MLQATINHLGQVALAVKVRVLINFLTMEDSLVSANEFVAAVVRLAILARV